MHERHLGWPSLIVMLGGMIVGGGCMDGADAADVADVEDVAFAACSPDPDAYTPYTSGSHPVGAVTALPWRGFMTTYPAGAEDFRGYGPSSPATVECGSSKGLRSHVDVTSGCLTATNVGSEVRGRITSTDSGAFRAVALGFTDTSPLPIKWTDQSTEFRFYYAGTSGAGVLPGFKAFARYRSEDDLYVASWRVDGVVQIQKKVCGVYTALKVLKAFGAPSTNQWHRMRFDAIGDRLDLYLDGALVISTTDAALSWGTVGIRTDAMTGAYLDDWRVGQPVGGHGPRAERQAASAFVDVE